VTTDSYEAIPYESGPFAETHPRNLAVLGRLFGLACPDPERARVLELGCASGGNIIPMAYYLPQASFLGIELSAPQAQAGMQFIEALGIGNIRIAAADILQLAEDIGTFDYVIAHGLFSWAPPPVRERIFSLCARHLSPQGIAYISFNTLPGWRQRGMLRDMLLYHTRGLREPAARLAAAQAFLESFGRALDGMEALHARYLCLELERIRGNHPSYLFHEYLEETNEPLLFSDFVAQAARHDLRYLCDADLHMMLGGDIGEAPGQWPEQASDPIAREQYQDFIRNRAFRGTLLCRAATAVGGELDLEQFERLAFHGLLVPRKAVEWRKVREQEFLSPGGEHFPVSHPLTKAALQHLASVYPDSVAAGVLASAAQDLLAAGGNREQAGEIEHMLAEVASLYVRRALGAEWHERQVPHGQTERPSAIRLARLQAGHGIGHLTTPRHMPVGLDDFAAHLVGLLDGTRTLNDLVNAVVAETPAAASAALPTDEAGRTGRDRLVRETRERCAAWLALLARQGLLEPASPA
jgi:SAM-dependent methyltransferase